MANSRSSAHGIVGPRVRIQTRRTAKANRKTPSSGLWLKVTAGRRPVLRSIELIEGAPIDVLLERGLPGLFEDERAEHERIHLRAHEAEIGVLGGTDDGFPAYLEARVHQDRTAGQLVKSAEQ